MILKLLRKSADATFFLIDAPAVKTQWQAVRRGTESVNELFEIDGGESFWVMAEDDESKLHTFID